eukprot:363205-Chlamydomonas_euryale.AAC.1
MEAQQATAAVEDGLQWSAQVALALPAPPPRYNGCRARWWRSGCTWLLRWSPPAAIGAEHGGGGQ